MKHNDSQPLEARVGVGTVTVGRDFLERLLGAGVEVRKAPLNIYGKPQWKPANRKWEFVDMKTVLKPGVSYECISPEPNRLGLGLRLIVGNMSYKQPRTYNIDTFTAMKSGILVPYLGRFDNLSWQALAEAQLILPVAKQQNGKHEVA